MRGLQQKQAGLKIKQNVHWKDLYGLFFQSQYYNGAVVIAA